MRNMEWNLSPASWLETWRQPNINIEVFKKIILTKWGQKPSKILFIYIILTETCSSHKGQFEFGKWHITHWIWMKMHGGFFLHFWPLIAPKALIRVGPFQTKYHTICIREVVYKKISPLPLKLWFLKVLQFSYWRSHSHVLKKIQELSILCSTWSTFLRVRIHRVIVRDIYPQKIKKTWRT